jgi:Zn finger protein HypA/HybF involved in hydrogenase expression
MLKTFAEQQLPSTDKIIVEVRGGVAYCDSELVTIIVHDNKEPEVLGTCTRCGSDVVEEIDEDLKKEYKGYCPGCDENKYLFEITPKKED